MGEIVNLRRVRRRRAREEAAKAAVAARLRSGVSAAEREAAAALREKETMRLEGHRLDEPKDPPEE